MLLILIEKLSNECDSFRKAREAHIIYKAKTLEPALTNVTNYNLLLKKNVICFSYLSSHTLHAISYVTSVVILQRIYSVNS